MIIKLGFKVTVLCKVEHLKMVHLSNCQYFILLNLQCNVPLTYSLLATAEPLVS